jgi:4-alpha-glucanotransferase
MTTHSFALFTRVSRERAWFDWPEPLRTRQAQALAEARAELGDEILFRQYLQWLAGEQWRAARRGTGEVALFGDLPFMVSGDSADVWARQDEFRLDASVGVPPDAFSETGQDWGLPVYRWDVFAQRDFDWLRDRAHRNADLFDGYRVDHLVGFYRTFYRANDGTRRTSHQRRSRSTSGSLANSVVDGCSRARLGIIAEDLGWFRSFGVRRWRDSASPATKCSAGSGTGTWTANHSRIRGSEPPVSVADFGHARHRTDGELVGRKRLAPSGSLSWQCPSVRAVTDRL